MKTFETEKHNIPGGATHYENETSISHFAWFKLSGDDLLCMPITNPDMWLPCSLEFCKDSITPIPQTNIETPEEKEVEWGGAGLPAVGVECEAVFIEHEHKGYGEFLILGYHGDYVWMEYIGELSNKSKHYTAKVNMVKFRKPETEAERVERERNEWIEKFAYKVKHVGTMTYKDILGEMYDSLK